MKLRKFGEFIPVYKKGHKVLRKEFNYSDGSRMMGAPRGEIIQYIDPDGSTYYDLQIGGHGFIGPKQNRGGKYLKDGKWMITQDFQYLDDLWNGNRTDYPLTQNPTSYESSIIFNPNWASELDLVSPTYYIDPNNKANNPTIKIALPKEK